MLITAYEFPIQNKTMSQCSQFDSLDDSRKKIGKKFILIEGGVNALRILNRLSIPISYQFQVSGTQGMLL